MNKKIRLIILTLIVCVSTTVLNAQTTPEEITNQFFNTYKNDPLKAIDEVFRTNKWMIERKLDEVENVKSQFSNFLGLVGDYYGYEKITEKNVGESYKLTSYLIKYDRQPIRFTFVFYKPKDKWMIQSFLYDDALEDELKE